MTCYDARIISQLPSTSHTEQQERKQTAHITTPLLGEPTEIPSPVGEGGRASVANSAAGVSQTILLLGRLLGRIPLWRIDRLLWWIDWRGRRQPGIHGLLIGGYWRLGRATPANQPTDGAQTQADQQVNDNDQD